MILLVLGRKADEDEMERRRNLDNDKKVSETLKEIQGYIDREKIDRWWMMAKLF